MRSIILVVLRHFIFSIKKLCVTTQTKVRWRIWLVTTFQDSGHIVRHAMALLHCREALHAFQNSLTYSYCSDTTTVSSENSRLAVGFPICAWFHTYTAINLYVQQTLTILDLFTTVFRVTCKEWDWGARFPYVPSVVAQQMPVWPVGA